uniref:Uncharacterized protein n=1 Tax=Sinocyclocheilus grahami TaxID=75366 RepID=A0A672QJW8_SINGR
MASSSVVSEKSLTCSICLDVFTDPVTTSCGHNFCMVCIRSHRDCSPCTRCPLCGKAFDSKQDLNINRTIKEFAEGIKRKRIQEKAEVSCDSCPEKKMQTAIKSCLHCGTSFCESHLEPHKTAEKLMKHKLINPVKNLDEYICKNHERPLDLYCKDDQTAICQFCIESDHRNHNTVLLETESLFYFVSCFDNVVMIFQSNAVLLELTEEKHKETERRGKELIRELDEEIVELKRRQTELEQLSHPMDFTQVCLSHQTMVRNNATCTLGKEGFSSQKFYYEVQVSGMEWDLGVAKESIDRKGDIGLNPENGYWTIWLRNRDEYAANVRTPVPLTLKEKPVKVGVFVDFEGGLISFYDVECLLHCLNLNVFVGSR